MCSPNSPPICEPMRPVRSRYPEPALDDGVVRLRPWVDDDARALQRAWHDPAIVEHCEVPTSRSIRYAKAWIAGCAERARSARAIDLVIADSNRPELVTGEIGLGPFDHERRAAMVGFWTNDQHRRKGLSLRALKLVTAWARADLELSALLATTANANLDSHSVLSRAGFGLLKLDEQNDVQTWAKIY